MRWPWQRTDPQEPAAIWYTDRDFWETATRARAGDAAIVEQYRGRLDGAAPTSIVGLCFERFDRRWEGWLAARIMVKTRAVELDAPLQHRTEDSARPDWYRNQPFRAWARMEFVGEWRTIEGLDGCVLHSGNELVRRTAHDFQRRWDGWCWAIDTMRAAA